MFLVKNQARYNTGRFPKQGWNKGQEFLSAACLFHKLYLHFPFCNLYLNLWMIIAYITETSKIKVVRFFLWFWSKLFFINSICQLGNVFEGKQKVVAWTLSNLLSRYYMSSQGYGFSSGHVWMWELDCEESWELKNWCFWTMVLEKTLESPLDCKEIQPVHPKGDQSWVFIGRTEAEAETPILWPPHVKSWLTGKDPDAGRDWGQEEKETAEDEIAGWHHWLDGHKFG